MAPTPDPPVVRIVMARELRAGLRGFLAWLVPVTGMVVLVCALQPSFAGQGGLLAAKLQSMPEGMRSALGLAMADFHRPPAYLATNFLYVALATGLAAALLGAGMVAREEILHTAELLYVQPTSRERILGGKAAALAVFVLAFPLILGLVAAAVLAAVVPAPLEPGLIAAMFAGTAALGVCFAGAGMLVATLVRDARSASGAALGLVLGTFFVGVISSLAAPVAWLRWVSPFKQVEAGTIVARGGLDPVPTVALVLIGGAAAAAAIVRYRRKDLHA